MTPTLKLAATPLDEAKLRQLAGRTGPCVTLLIPDRRPGAADGSRHLVARELLRSATEQLQAHKWNAHPADLLAPLGEFAGVINGGGGNGLAAFCAPDFFELASVPGQENAVAVVANHFRLAPFVSVVFAPRDFFILGLNRRKMRLLHYSHGRCEPAPWPAAVPASEDDFKNFDKPDHELRNRSASGSSTGAMSAVVFGNTSAHEDRREFEHHYYLAVDRALKEVLKDAPLLLAGLREEAAEYRRAAKHCRLLETFVEGHPEQVTPNDLAPRAAQAALDHHRMQGEAMMAKYREMPDRARTLEGVREVWKAAAAGRVHQLCAAEGVEFPGDIHHPHSHEDLINAAIVETLKNGGDVFMLPQDRLPAGSPVAAILRF